MFDDDRNATEYSYAIGTMQILWEIISGGHYGHARLLLPYNSIEFLKRIIDLRDDELQMWHRDRVISDDCYRRVLKSINRIVDIITANSLDLSDDERMEISVNISIIQTLFLFDFYKHNA